MAVEKDFILYFEHDPIVECGTLQASERGVKLKDIFRLVDLG